MVVSVREKLMEFKVLKHILIIFNIKEFCSITIKVQSKYFLTKFLDLEKV